MPSLSIIIVNYFTSGYLKKCLKTLYAHTKSLKFEVIIVDNSMSPNEHLKLRKLEKLYGSLTIIANTKNSGFGSANNLGAKYAKAKYLLLLNPDTEIVDDSVLKLLKFLKFHQEIGALTSLLYQKDKKTLQRAFFGKFQNLSSLTIRRYNYQKVDMSREFFYTNIVTGAALMIKNSLYKKLGGFDERFFMYLEDDDLCKRISDLGYKNAVLNTAKIIHFEGASTTKKTRSKYYFESQKLFFKKHNGILATLGLRLLRFPYRFIRARI
jgi:GT2 family glycosyltransferase